MPSVIEPLQNRAAHETGRTNPPVKRNTLQNHLERVPKEKTVLPPRGNINPKFQEKARVVKKCSVQPIPLKSSKPWPGSDNKATSSKKDEIIKHMSNVPSYLQKNIQIGENYTNNNIQGKALNFGVLEWGALEKYTTQKQRDIKFRENSTKKSHLDLKYRDNFIKKPHSDLNASLKFKSKDDAFKKQEESSTGPSCSNTERNGDNGFDLCKTPLKSEKNQNNYSGEIIYQTPPPLPHSCPNLPCEERNLSNNSVKNHEKSNRNIIEPMDQVSTAGFNQMNRSFSLRESNNGDKDKESSNRKGRQSPLRRMLDPLLKHNKNPALNKESSSLNAVRRSIDGLSNLHYPKTLNPKTETSSGATSTAMCGTIRNEKNESLNKQALLQLAWKNGLPLFMLSCGDSDILAATIKTKSFSLSEKDKNNNNNHNQESVYSVFTVQESKKKGGVLWINKQGKKNKKQQLVSNEVGEVRVSLSKSKCGTNSQNYHFSRQFILVTETKPLEEDSNSNSNSNSNFNSNSNSNSNSNFDSNSNSNSNPDPDPDSDSESKVLNKSELAAIITNLPQRDCFCSKKCSVNAILPSGIHGHSNYGKPLPLIERWKMKGGCDCGGWDEGCMLSILTNNYFHEINDQRFELFTQGKSKEQGCTFSMTCFKEGLYTVEFKSSINLLQAFVICIAFLHGRNPMKEKIELESKNEAQALFVRKSAASYVPHHPPLSPVGRA